MADEEKVKVLGFEVLITVEDGTYIAIVPALPGCVNEGISKEDVVKKIAKTIHAYLLVVAEENFKKNEAKKIIPIEEARKRKRNKSS
jgi:predicted RNase H-like HicB family nuclease